MSRPTGGEGCELVRAVHADGPQYVTRHGKDVVVIVDVEEFERTRIHRPDFKSFLASAPGIADLQIERDPTRVPRVELPAP
ncbi:MAG: type II toxin-antitoxin system prevent-host-death family antitoxin [Nocardioidaceae bacterium]